jgi:hypothetical protein
MLQPASRYAAALADVDRAELLVDQDELDDVDAAS